MQLNKPIQATSFMHLIKWLRVICFVVEISSEHIILSQVVIEYMFYCNYNDIVSYGELFHYIKI